MRLSNLPWPKAEEYFRAHDTVLIGIGSIECHGRHLPQGTATRAQTAAVLMRFCTNPAH